jgi:hypothetical protein
MDSVQQERKVLAQYKLRARKTITGLRVANEGNNKQFKNYNRYTTLVREMFPDAHKAVLVKMKEEGSLLSKKREACQKLV